MKIKVEFDLTPEEFRSAMGLPDIKDLQKEMVDDIKEKMTSGVEGYDSMSMMQPFLGQSAMPLQGFQKSITSMMEGYFTGGADKSKDK